jgi:hypothetical protein
MGMYGHLVAVDAAGWEQVVEAGESVEWLPEGSLRVELDKAWQALWFALDGDREESGLRFAVPLSSGRQIDEMGSTAVTPEQVREAAAELAALDEASFRARYDAVAMGADFYPKFDQVSDREQYGDFVASYYGDLQEFYQKAAAAGLGVVFHVDL